MTKPIGHLRRTAGPFAAAAALTLALAACGGGTDPEPAAEDTPAQTETEVEDTEEDTRSPDTEPDEAETQAAGLPADPFADLKVAADAVGWQGNAKALASGIIEATGMEGSTDQPAVQVYANLSQLLQEHVYLAGIAVDTGLSFGLDSEAFNAAAATLDSNSVELADLIAQAAPDQRDAFLSLWREHIGFFVDYARGAAADDQDLKDQALSDLQNYRQQSGAFFEEISGGAIPADAVVTELDRHVETLTAAIDAAAAGDTTVFDNLKESATAVGEDEAAKALATGFAQALDLEGDVDSQGALVYAKLSTLLEEHVYISGITVKTAYAAGLDSEALAAAEATLDTNSVELADLVGQIAPDQRDAFLELWRQHIGFFVDYAKGAAAGDQDVKDQAISDLSGYREQAGSFFESISSGAIPADAVAQGLDNHVETLSAAIDSLATVLVE